MTGSVVASLVAAGHPCRDRLAVWLRQTCGGTGKAAENTLAAAVGCRPATARTFLEGRSWPSERHLLAMVDAWGAAFLLHVFSPLVGPESPAAVVARCATELALAQQEIADAESNLAAARASTRLVPPATAGGGGAADRAGALAGGAGAGPAAAGVSPAPADGWETAGQRLMRLAGATLGLLATLALLATANDGALMRARPPRVGGVMARLPGRGGLEMV